MLLTIQKIFSYLFTLFSIILLYFIITMVTHLIKEGKIAKVYKNDYSEIHSVQYGLFNSKVWADKIASIVDSKIDSFDFTASSRDEIKKYVETILDTLIVETDKAVREKNKSKKSFLGSIIGYTKQSITDSFFDIRALREKVPKFTDSIMDELEKPNNQKILKKVMRQKLHQLTAGTLTDIDMTLFNAILKKHNTKTFEACDKILNKKMSNISFSMEKQMETILTLVGFLLIFIIFTKTFNSITLLILSVTSVSLLISGIFLPMLDIEAKITKLYFTILDKPLLFENQILFFQTKSISDLVRLLLESGENRMILVGVLLTLFSIIFPTIKLFSTYLYYYSYHFIGNNIVVKFFALKSTKWSMADVMVVSIFMAYLGLDGVVTKELTHLREASQPINVITTNGTHLEIGFFLFLGFVFTSFVLSTLIESRRVK